MRRTTMKQIVIKSALLSCSWKQQWIKCIAWTMPIRRWWRWRQIVTVRHRFSLCCFRQVIRTATGNISVATAEITICLQFFYSRYFITFTYSASTQISMSASKNQTIKSERKSDPAHFVRISTFTHFVENWIFIWFCFNFVIENLTWRTYWPYEVNSAWPNLFSMFFSLCLLHFFFCSHCFRHRFVRCCWWRRKYREIGTFMDTPRCTVTMSFDRTRVWANPMWMKRNQRKI